MERSVKIISYITREIENAINNNKKIYVLYQSSYGYNGRPLVDENGIPILLYTDLIDISAYEHYLDKRCNMISIHELNKHLFSQIINYILNIKTPSNAVRENY